MKKTSPTLRNKKGFTLIEIMIVMAIIVFLVANFLVPDQRKKNDQIKKVVRSLAVMSKEIHSYAKLRNITYRLVIDMKSGKSSDTPHEFWVEKSEKKVFLGNPDEDEEEKVKLDEEGNPIDPDGFERDVKILRKPQALPAGLIFSEVELGTKEKPIVEGIAYIHFLPEGLVEESAIHIKYDEKIEWTLAIHPLTGKGDIIPKRVLLKDIREQ